MIARSLKSLAVAALLCVAPSLAFAAACSLTTISAGPPKILACTNTTATTITVPSDWNTANNKIEVIGGGQNGTNSTSSGSTAGPGGAGGHYAKNTNVSLTPGGSVSIQVGTNNPATSVGTAGDTWVSSTATLQAIGGGSSSADVGSTKFAGGAGGLKGSSYGGGGGGGGAAGPNGAGTAGENGAAAGSHGAAGGNADNNTVTGPAAPASTAGSVVGNSGTEFGASFGSGTGAAAAGSDVPSCTLAAGSNGGNYGGGGSGATGDTGSANCNGGLGIHGLIIMTYTPVSLFILSPSVIP